MTDPPQLKIASRHGFSRVLLESAQGDHSAPGAAQRALHALSVGVAVTTVAAAAKAGASTGLSTKWAGLLVVKWLGLGMLAGVTTLVSIEYVSARGDAPVSAAPAARRAAGRLATVRTNAAPPAPVVAPEATPEASQLPEAPPAHAASAVLPSSGAAEPAAEPPVAPAADQLSALRQVRAALLAQAPERALKLLDAFERQHRDSSLAEEAAVLRIEALADLGRDDARALAEDFLRQYPHSAYAQRVRSKLHLP
jgi:hypothetical protein